MASRARLLMVMLICSILLGGAGMAAAQASARTDATPLLIAARTDLESLANRLLGDSIRPIGWTNSFDVDAPSFAIDLRLDLELLAGTRLAPDQRPAGWFGAAPGTPWMIARDIRHDLEALADHQLGPDARPDLWIGAEPFMRCDRTLQAATLWLERTNAVFDRPAAQPGVNYCALLAQHVNMFSDIVLPVALPTGDLRQDLDALSAAIFQRPGVYPDGWTGRKDQQSVRQDLELLKIASSQVGQPLDESAWFGEIAIGPEWVVARANRHDLETLADARLGYGNRPQGWTSFDPLVRCPYTTQNLVSLLGHDLGLMFTTDPASASYCNSIALEASQAVEAALQDAREGAGGGGEGEPPVALASVEAMILDASTLPAVTAVGGIPGAATNPNAYLDPAARLPIGVVPRGMPFTALARSDAPDSRMMYVSGTGFNAWVAWPWTTLTEAEYMSLPLAGTVKTQLPQLLCFAGFCREIIHNGDPLGGPINVGMDGYMGGFDGSARPNLNLPRLDYAHVRQLVNVHDTPNNMAELRLQICPDLRNFNTCEPVIRLFENGRLVRPLRVENGLPVWRLTYRLHDTARLESRYHYADQLWVTHPHDR